MTPSTTAATPAATTARRRRSLSLRGRLLAGLIGLTAIFLVVMGVVSSLVLGHLEQSQFNCELKLAARQPVTAIAKGAGGFAAAYLSPRTGDYGELTPSTGASRRDARLPRRPQREVGRAGGRLRCAPAPPRTSRSTSR